MPLNEVWTDLLTLEVGPKPFTGKGSGLGQRADLFTAGLAYGHQEKPAAVQPAAPFHQRGAH